MAKKDELVGLRFRRAATLDGATYAANSRAVVTATDEAWDLVDTGVADLDPPSGQPLGDGTQPFPPERLTTAPAPVSPLTVATPVAPAPAKTKADAGDELDGMTVADLHEVAKTEGVTGYSTMHKDDLVKAIKKGRKK